MIQPSSIVHFPSQKQRGLEMLLPHLQATAFSTVSAALRGHIGWVGDTLPVRVNRFARRGEHLSGELVKIDVHRKAPFFADRNEYPPPVFAVRYTVKQSQIGHRPDPAQCGSRWDVGRNAET